MIAGPLTAEAGAPRARILDGMRRGAFPFLLSTALLAEYRDVPRSRCGRRSGRSTDHAGELLTEAGKT
jgi:hypothetical protein